ncbi:response regulator transcription factor [Streptomyces flavochromogenes]|uniref:Response regulator transcription factor n=1 Tax=Streptomyces flavochromogenes TaxID=68199 RepID=A0ABW6Y038_9ACTN
MDREQGHRHRSERPDRVHRPRPARRPRELHRHRRVPDLRQPPPRPFPGVTARERQALALVGRGLSNGEITERLHISAATAKAHVARLFTKPDARDRVQPVILAYEVGLAP